MESIQLLSDEYKSKSPSETQMRTSGDGGVGWGDGDEEAMRREEGEQQGKSLSLPNFTHSLMHSRELLNLLLLAA